METKEITILQALEKVHQTSKGSKLIFEKHDGVKHEVHFISSYFDINDVQSILLSSFICMSCFESIELRELMDYLEVEKITFLPHLSDLQLLEDKNILEKVTCRSATRDEYNIKVALLEFIISNREIPTELISIIPREDNFHEFLKELDDLSDGKDNKTIDYRSFVYKFNKLLEKSRKFKLVNFSCENL